LTKDNFPIQLLDVSREYNETIHSTTKQRPIVLHFAQRPRRWVKTLLRATAQRIQAIGSKQMAKAKMRLLPLAVSQLVRVLIWKDPRLSKQEQYKKRKKFTYKKFALSYWSRDVFEIAEFQNYHYRLEGYPKDWFVREELQKVNQLRTDIW
jgi:hypothetical protein